MEQGLKLTLKNIGDKKYSITIANTKIDDSPVNVQFTRGVKEVVEADDEFIFHSTEDNNIITLDTNGLEGEARTVIVEAEE
ncbi:hypothetical protein [Tetragenococcus halophilus]|uniref:hypothetical protein n=1 Tax=Tetragenococcus halophilus TaxID=51669 RepID=UPI0015BACC5B|nr:hypothetical protein [Tetragenococcus halophilus]NWO00518.1 hypothetical protein [Tetragenococcus halophilus]